MYKKLCFFICCLFVLVLLSLPHTINSSIQKKLFEKFLVLRYSSDEKDASLEAQERELNTWLHETEKQKEALEKQTSCFVPKGCPYIVAKTIFRTQNSWNSFLWIDVGDDDNLEKKPKIVAKNSPVLFRDSVVGVIDYVGKRASLVRLITDSALHPAVRVVRNFNDKELAYAVDTLEKETGKEGFFENEEEQKAFEFLLASVRKKINPAKPPLYLAKGILQGSAEPLWRSTNLILKGIGFNYDVKDAYGPSRDLRTGEPLDPQNEYPEVSKEAIPLLQVDDLLVTSGMDAVFPEGLKVARISHVSSLQEGAYFYELKAVPTAKELLDLRYVTILAPQNLDPQNLATRVDQILQQLGSVQE